MYYIGLNDVSKERTFVWTDRKPVSWAFWARGEPNNWYGEDCTVINYFKRQEGVWNDWKCEAKENFICKKNKPACPVAACSAPVLKPGCRVEKSAD